MSASNSENFVNMVQKNLNKYWKTAKNTGNVGEICQSEEVGTMSNVRAHGTSVLSRRIMLSGPRYHGLMFMEHLAHDMTICTLGLFDPPTIKQIRQYQ